MTPGSTLPDLEKEIVGSLKSWEPYENTYLSGLDFARKSESGGSVADLLTTFSPSMQLISLLSEAQKGEIWLENEKVGAKDF